MRISFLHVGRFKSPECSALVDRYLRLAQKFCNIQGVELILPKNLPEQEAQGIALERWLEKQKKPPFLTILDEGGKQFKSIEFASQIEKIQNSSFSEWVIAVGGAHGYATSVKARAQLLWSLSASIMQHDLAAVVAAEQVYRGFAILNNHPYHHA